MKKLLRFFDDTLLKFGVGFTIAFIALYPKLPSIHVNSTWVYIRLEDFLIAIVVIIWLIQLLRKKVKLPFPIASPIILYWIIGLISLGFSLIFIAPHLANFFPKIAALQYLRRIEYMILFFVAFSTVKTKKDIRDYLFVLCFTIVPVLLYGFAQKFYIPLSTVWPWYFEQLGKNPVLYCFPSFLTGNEEFAKGAARCLDQVSRITSTFGGHYDLAAYLVVVIPIFIALFLAVKNWYGKIITAILSIGSIALLNFTASRVSFASYLIGMISMLIFWKRKKWILPIFLVSFLVLLSSDSSTWQRFLKTIQPVQVVTISQNPTSPAVLPGSLKNIIDQTKETEENKAPQSPPPGAYTIGGTSNPSSSVGGPTTNTGPITTVITDAELHKLQLANEDIIISTVSGKVYALDISFTTRFQAEWPRDWAAFLKSPIFGTGYSSLTLASDNDYLRALGETGLAGFLSFFLIFIFLGMYMKNVMSDIADPFTRALLFGLAGGVVGLLVNASMIDVFEASKVAEPLWILLGIGVGGIALYQKKTINYKQELLAFFTSRAMIAIYFLLLTLIIFLPTINNFFVADDFTWLHWVSNASFSDAIKYFVDAGGFFYRPLDKVIVSLLSTLFYLEPQGYHVFSLFLHLMTTIGVYVLLEKLFKKRVGAIIGALLFLVLPAHAENVYWFSTISTTLSALFIVWAVVAWIHFRENKFFAYTFALLLSILAFLSYEMAIIVLPLFFVTDIFVSKVKNVRNILLAYIPFVFVTLMYLYVRVATHAVSFGGDYAYNPYHFIPNFFGNLFGYIGMFVSGEYVLPFYGQLRADLKIYSLPLAVILGAVFLVALIVGFVRKEQIHTLWKKGNNRLFLYGIFFTIVSLIPFIGLGNITQRYFYLASIGCIISLVAILQSVLFQETQYRKKTFFAIILISIIVFIWSAISLRNESKQWQHAGEITKKTLAILSSTYPSAVIPPTARVYFVNVPIRKENAWIFPVGLSDALWFVYRESSPTVYQVKTIQEAKDSAKSDITHPSFIFMFDKNGDLEEVK